MKIKCPCCQDELEVSEEDIGEKIRCRLCGEKFILDAKVVPSEFRIVALRARAQQGDMWAQFVLARCYDDGDGVEEDFEKALAWYEKAAAQGHGRAQYELAECYDNGWGVSKDFCHALKLYHSAAEKGVVEAQVYLGKYYEEIIGGLKYDEAVNWYKKAAKQGDLEAQYLLGTYYESGDGGLPADIHAAVKLYRESAEAGYGYAQAAMAECYLEGKGVERDAIKAALWYVRMEGSDCDDGRTVHALHNPESKEIRDMLKWARLVAKKEDAEAMYQLGLCYATGKVVKKDDVKALEWYLKAANGGCVAAMRKYGECLLFGKGIERDSAEAVRWLRKAAERGNWQAQIDLCFCLLHGLGSKRDDNAAESWRAKIVEGSLREVAKPIPVDAGNEGKAIAAEPQVCTGNVSNLGELGDVKPIYGNDGDSDRDDLFFAMLEAALEGVRDGAKGDYRRFALGIDEILTPKEDQSIEKWAISAFENSQWAVGVMLAEKTDMANARLQYYIGHCFESGLYLEMDEEKAFEWYSKAAKNGNSQAQYQLGECYEYGVGVSESDEEAFKWYKVAAENGVAVAQLSLGFCYEHGNGVSQDMAEAFKWYKKSAENGWARGAYHLGLCYETGKGVSVDVDAARVWYKKAVEGGDEDAKKSIERMNKKVEEDLVTQARAAFAANEWDEALELARKTGPKDASLQSWMGNSYEFGYGVGKNLDEAFKWHKAAAENGNEWSQYKLGEFFEHGKGTDKNLDEAFKWYKIAAENGSVAGQCCLGNMYEYGKGTKENIEEAFKWYKVAAENGHAEGQNALGVLYENGKGTEKNYEEALKWFLKSAEQNNRCAQCNLGLMYEYGRGTAVDLLEAVKWYKKSAENGWMRGEYRLGLCYETGKGVEVDVDTARAWYEKAAEGGDEDAKKCLERMEKKREEELVSNAIAAFKANKWNEAFELARKTGLKDAVLQSWMGYCYECGNGVEKNLKEAFKWYEKSALNGSGWSQCRLGYSYEYGNGTERNYEKALEWYAKAAEQGNNCAQCNLGLMFEYGRGVPIGLATAFQWYKKSAESGWAVGKYRLGLCYETGKGVAIDVEAARGWYKKAAYDGNEDAKKALLRLDEEQNKVANLNHVVASNPQSTCGHGRKLRKPTKRNAINEMYRYITKIMIEEYEIKDIEFDDVDDYLYAVEVPNDTDEDILMDASNLFFHEIGILEDERDLELEEETEYCTVHRNEHSGKYFVIFNHPFVIDAKAAGEMVGDTVREFVEATRKRLAENEARESDGDEDDGDEAWMRELADGIKSGEVRSRSGEGYFVLAGEPFDEIKSGEKTTEYRDITPRNLSMSIGIRTVKIQRGYGHPGQPPAQMRFEVQSVGFLDANKCECDPYDIPEGFIATTIAIHLGKRIE